ncbi:hypothetical protein SAMN06265371_10518 [Lutibacter agarilyticus]|uniref:Uncharacterized protein n=1 Tax=Lutibacter agarilyticus TaxID=1109740 RepID=A0A238X7U9_9FLAO|nr:hypothetical protein [Lutibacter agarilyticus]SNR54414.1 hypothetical protein SAMN06265371_10518 [Lutibacter agarilyticus]
MKVFFTLISTILISTLVTAQTEIPVINSSIENTTPFYQNKRNGDKWSLEGFWFNENSTQSKFDAANSGLAPGEGIDDSQAVKSKVINGNGAASEVTLVFGDNDISSYGPGIYTFTFHVKALKPVSSRPFWIVLNTLDRDKKVVSAPEVTTVDNGGTVSWRGLENGYLSQSITVKIADNTEGKNIKYLRLQIQHAIFTNTYWFDNFKLTKE